MEKPVFFELDGKFAAFVPKSDGGASVIKDSGAPNIADFMQTGTVIGFDDLPEDFQASVQEVLAKSKAA
ncbi:MAG: hypothetical protein JST30_09720 [Armatimonadetes bacterium]|nr:hypothetical protein [Armatimonadota bacterium]